MTIGCIFKAVDKLNRTYTYELKEIDTDDSMRQYKLFNIDLQCDTEVENEWFNQRKITVLKGL